MCYGEGNEFQNGVYPPIRNRNIPMLATMSAASVDGWDVTC